MNTRFRIGVVMTGAVMLSTLAINASDVLRGIEGSLPGMAIESTGPCGAGAVLLQFGGTALCVDTYEASPGKECPIAEPSNELETLENMKTGSCAPQTTGGVIPWRFVTLTQSQQLCARAGKRLPTNEEWYKAVSGMGDVNSCSISNKSDKPDLAGSASCVTPSGIHDMVGNVWEWIDEEVTDGVYSERVLPDSGYVTLVDSDGVVVETGATPRVEFGSDYAWTSNSGLRGIIRGGFYNSGTDAGIFTINASVPLDFRATGVGFRCVKDV